MKFEKYVDDFIAEHPRELAAFLLALSDVPGVPALEATQALFEREGPLAVELLGLVIASGFVETRNCRLYLTSDGEQLVRALRIARGEKDAEQAS